MNLKDRLLPVYCSYGIQKLNKPIEDIIDIIK